MWENFPVAHWRRKRVRLQGENFHCVPHPGEVTPDVSETEAAVAALDVDVAVTNSLVSLWTCQVLKSALWRKLQDSSVPGWPAIVKFSNCNPVITCYEHICTLHESFYIISLPGTSDTAYLLPDVPTCSYDLLTLFSINVDETSQNEMSWRWVSQSGTPCPSWARNRAAVRFLVSWLNQHLDLLHTCCMPQSRLITKQPQTRIILLLALTPIATLPQGFLLMCSAV